MGQHNIKSQLLIGISGTFLVFLLWKLSAPHLVRICPPALLQFLNALSILSLCIPILLVLILSKESPRSYFPLTDLSKQITTGLCIGFCMSAILTVLPTLLGIKVYGGSGYQNVAEAITGLGYFVFIVGLSEEFIFRGFLYEKLDSIFLSDGIPIILSSVLFGLFHLPNISLLQILIGCFFCICKRKIPGCTLLSLAIAHGIHDWMIRIIISIP